MEFFKLTKKEIIKVIADKYTEFTQKEIGEILDAFLDTVKDVVSAGDKISLPKFGIFESRERAARTARNPATGESIEVAACKVCKFKPAADFKNMVKG